MGTPRQVSRRTALKLGAASAALGEVLALGGVTGDEWGNTAVAVFGLATGYGLDESILRAYGFLVDHYEDYTFAVVGINQNFRPVKLDACNPSLCGGVAPNAAGVCPTGTPGATNCATDIEDVVHDTDSPLQDPTNNLANTFQSDVRSFGAIQNDFAPPGSLLYGYPGPAFNGQPVACTAATADTVCQGLVAASVPLGACPGVCDTSPDANNGFCVAGVFCKDYHGSGPVFRM